MGQARTGIAIAVAAATAFAVGGSSCSNNGSGANSAGTGGGTATGGTTSSGHGGASATGGAAAMGGGAGGQSGGNGGDVGPGAGGTPISTGGASATGGGGSPGTGGAAASGGAAATGGAGRGGGSGTGGSAGGSGQGGTPDGGSPAASTTGNLYDGARTTTISFDAAWRFHLGDTSGAQATTFDDSAWTSLDVPHDWSIALAFSQSSASGPGGGYLDGGVGWYRKSFSLPAASSGQRVLVQFDGVYMDSTVWMNGTQVCARPYGYVSFECDFTSAAKFGASNVVAVRVNNQLPSSRWYSGSGIYRHVWLKTVNPLRIAYTGTRVTTPQISTSSASVDLTVTIQNDASSSQSLTVASTISDPSGAVVAQNTAPAVSVAAGKTSDVAQTMTVTSPKIWSLSSAALYSVVTTVSVNGAVVDTYTTPFGIRSFAFDPNKGFSLNGQSVKLNGVCNHHDLGSLGAAVNFRAIQKRLEMLKEMGVNALRTSHNPPAPELLYLADSMGFLVMDEAFDVWNQAKVQYDYARFFNTWGTTDIADMVSRDRNHPSVIIWSIGNEIPNPTPGTAQTLIAAVKTKDTTRVIAQAFNPYNAPTAAVEDLVGINYNTSLYDSVHSGNPSWKIFASESSSAVRSRGVYKLPVTSNVLTSSDTQCSSYDNSVVAWGSSAEASWTEVNTRSFVAGEFIWTGFDYIGEPTPYSWPAKSSYFGAIDTAGFPKDIFYFYQSRWNHAGPTMVHITPMDWTSWTAGQSVPVFVYSNADSVELFLNGTSLGSKNVVSTAGQANAGHLQWTVTFAAGTLQAKATKSGAVVATDVVQTAGSPAAVVLKSDRATISADGQDLAFVEADVVDAKGVIVPQASNEIAFSVSGPGVVVGVDNGNAISHEPYKGTTRAAFSGKALAIIQSTATPGMVTVTATSGSAAKNLVAGSTTVTTLAP
jgi:beta-galactosidase